MKKTISILLLFIFLFSSSGYSINTHYCHGKIISVNLLFNKGCSCGSKKMSKDCCKNKTEIVKIKDNYIPTPNAIVPATELLSFAFAYIHSFNLSITENLQIESNLNYLYPPDKFLSLSILYRSILI